MSSVEIQRTTADLRNQILESLTGLGELGRGLSGFNGSLRQAGDLIVQVSSSGQMNAIRTNQIKSMETLSDSLSALVAIESNTRYNRYLESIDRRLGTLLSNGSLRAAGLA